MRKPVIFHEDGSMDLQLEDGGTYILTKWYGSSLAVFEEKDFQKYIGKLDTQETTQGRSVIRYFLSAAVTMMTNEGDGWQIPPVLMAFIGQEGEAIYSWQCHCEGAYQDMMPVMILAAESHLESAIAMTKERHQA